MEQFKILLCNVICLLYEGKKGVKTSVKYEYPEFNGGPELSRLWVHYYGNSGTASV